MSLSQGVAFAQQPEFVNPFPYLSDASPIGILDEFVQTLHTKDVARFIWDLLTGDGTFDYEILRPEEVKLLEWVGKKPLT